MQLHLPGEKCIKLSVNNYLLMAAKREATSVVIIYVTSKQLMCPHVKSALASDDECSGWEMKSNFLCSGFGRPGCGPASVGRV